MQTYERIQQAFPGGPAPAQVVVTDVNMTEMTIALMHAGETQLNSLIIQLQNGILVKSLTIDTLIGKNC